ncbi:MAG TPA: hypothetical protein V6C95_02505 [Coleofasciculaceae cyanobacterium]
MISLPTRCPNSGGQIDVRILIVDWLPHWLYCFSRFFVQKSSSRQPLTREILKNTPSAQETLTVNCPGVLILMTPPQAQLQIAVFGSAGILLILVMMAPGFHGPTGTGTQGIGVRTPKAAVVAAATAGLAMELHIPNGGIFVMGTKSIIVAASTPPTDTGGPLGITIKELGASPNGTH